MKAFLVSSNLFYAYCCTLCISFRRVNIWSLFGSLVLNNSTSIRFSIEICTFIDLIRAISHAKLHQLPVWHLVVIFEYPNKIKLILYIYIFLTIGRGEFPFTSPLLVFNRILRGIAIKIFSYLSLT